MQQWRLKYPGQAGEDILGGLVRWEWWGEGVSQDRKCEALGLCFKEIVRISSFFCDIVTDLEVMGLLLGLWCAAIVNGEE